MTIATPPSSSGTASRLRFSPPIMASVGLIVLGTVPILFSCNPVPSFSWLAQSPWLQQSGRLFLAVLVLLTVVAISRMDPEPRPAKMKYYGGFILLAALLTAFHFYTVDKPHLGWQIDQYRGVLQHTYVAPDQYRFLPQGILWWMMLSNADFVFSFLVYRFFFTFLLCLAIYKFGRLYLNPRGAVNVVLLYAVFYPLSTRYYYGNMLDPMSHAAMLAALICCYRRQFWPFFWLLVLGMFIKETMLLLIPCYWLMNGETRSVRDSRLFARLALLGVAGVAMFLACRLPFHFNYDFKTLNRTRELMIYSNLGLQGAKHGSEVSVFQRHLHPVLFIFMWLPLIIWKREYLPRSLFWTALYLALSFYATNLCFGWNYESRNFIPPLIVLLVGTLVILNRLSETRSPGDPVRHQTGDSNAPRSGAAPRNG